MLIGDKQKFAIEIELLEIVDGWMFGTFLFWLAGEVVGDPKDRQVDLKGCLNWLKDFIHNSRNRFEPGLYEMVLDRAFLLLNGSVIPGNQDVLFVKEPYDDVFSRFHIGHLGMSSFDHLNIILIENENQQQRCIWRQNSQEIKEAFLSKGRMQEIATMAVDHFESENGELI
jgi:hypothetical protein